MKSQFVVKTIAVSLLTLVACAAHAQQYPSKPVRVVVPFAPGGGSDITARQFSNKLSEYLGQQFVVDNRGGAGGLIGMEQTAKSPPDGYTIMMMSGSFSATSAVQRPAFDPINSIIAVAEFGYTPFVLAVHQSLPSKTVKELISLARTTKGGLSYAGTGLGGATHLATELFSSMAKIKMVAIQYKSTGAAMSDLLGGQVPVIVGSLLPVTPHLPTGKLRALGVTTDKRASTAGTVARWWAASDAFIDGMASVCTPITRTSGRTAARARATPAMSPPPPLGTTTTDASGTYSAISSPTVPFPAITSGLSTG